jgi:diguanylate cyclase (GGDEF)-like protein/PAS domain S-box-containing protein
MDDQNRRDPEAPEESDVLRRVASTKRAVEEEHDRTVLGMIARDAEKNLALSSISDWVVFFDRELRVRWANPAAVNSTGSRLESIVGRHCYEIWCERQSPCIGCPVVRAIETGKAQRGEMTTADGRTLQITGSPVKDDMGNLLGAVETVMEVTERRRAEEALLEREQNFRAFVETTNEWIWSIDLEGRHTYCNPAVESILGYSPREIVGRDSLSHMHPEDRRQVEAMLKTKIALQEGWSGLVLRWRHKNGELRYLESSAVPIRDQTGRLLGFQGADRDITGYRRAEEALRESAARFRTLVETTSDWIWEVDAQITYIYASPKVRELLGYEPHEVIGKKPFDLMPPEEARRVAALLAPIVAAAESFAGLENLNRHKDGQLVILETSGIPILDASGTLQGYRGIDRDISERKRAEQSLRESEEKHRLLFETMAQGVVYQSEDGAIISANHAAEKILGLTLDQMKGRTSMDPRWHAIHEDGTQYAGDQHPAMIALRTGEVVSDAVMGIFHPLERRHRWIVVSAIPQFRSGESRPFGVYATFTDITERKRTEESLKYLSAHDVLTGLFNRLFFEEEISRLDRGRQFPISVFVVDVDGLKTINDGWGHSAGDELLRRTASILKETFRAEEIVARIGGDEFAVLLPRTGAEAADMRLGSVRSKLSAHNAAYPGPPLSFSLGVATAEKAGSVVEALKQADARMYEEKQSRKKAL